LVHGTMIENNIYIYIYIYILVPNVFTESA
jgi:hypothetical protein